MEGSFLPSGVKGMSVSPGKPPSQQSASAPASPIRPSSSSSSPSAAINSSPFRPQSGAGGVRPTKTVIGATAAGTPPRPVPPPSLQRSPSGGFNSNETASRGDEQATHPGSFQQRSVMDALHDVLRDRRGAAGARSASFTTASELPNVMPGAASPPSLSAASSFRVGSSGGAAPPPPRPQPPTPFSARTNNTRQKYPQQGGGGSSNHRSVVLEQALGGSGEFVPPAQDAPRRSLGSARGGAGARRPQPLPPHLQPQPSAFSAEPQPFSASSLTEEVPLSSFFPAGDLEESLRRKRAMWTQRHSFPSSSSGGPIAGGLSGTPRVTRSSSGSRLHHHQSSAPSSSLFDLGATSQQPPPPPLPPPFTQHSTAAPSSIFGGGDNVRQMRQQHSDRDGYFPRSFAAQQQQQHHRRTSSGSSGVFSPMMSAAAQQQCQPGTSSSSCSFSSSMPSSSSMSNHFYGGHHGFNNPNNGGGGNGNGGAAYPQSSSSNSSSGVDSSLNNGSSSASPSATPGADGGGSNSNTAAAAAAATVAALKAEGNALFTQRRYVEAHRAYSQGLELDPQNAVLFSNRAAVHLSVNNIDAAIRDCQQAVMIDPAFWRAHVRLARAYALRGACDHAIEAAKRALALFPPEADDDAGAASSSSSSEEVRNIKQQLAATRVWERARLEHEGGNAVGALRLLDDAAFAASVFADDMAVRLFKARLQLHIANVSSANGSFAARAAPNAAAPPSGSGNTGSNSAASCKAELSKYVPTATQLLESALNLVERAPASPQQQQQQQLGGLLLAGPLPAIPPMLNNFVAGLCELLVASARAAVLTGWHHAANARSTLRLCFLLRPDHGAAAALERGIAAVSAHMEDAAQAMADGRAAEAHAGLTAALTVDPTNARLRGCLLLLRSEASIALGRFDAAATDCTEVLAAEPGNSRALLRRSQASERAGNFAGAVSDMQRAVEAQPGLQEELAALLQRLEEAGAQFTYDAKPAEQQSNSGSGDSFFFAGGSGAPPRPNPKPGATAQSNNGTGSFRQPRGPSARKSRDYSSYFSGSGSNNEGSHAAGGSRPSSSSFRTRDGHSSSRAQDQQQQQQQQPQVATLYDVLGVPRDADVSLIRAVYLKKCLAVHPDRLVRLPEAERKQGEEFFKAIAAAYEILSDEEQRTEYDLSLLVSRF